MVQSEMEQLQPVTKKGYLHRLFIQNKNRRAKKTIEKSLLWLRRFFCGHAYSNDLIG